MVCCLKLLEFCYYLQLSIFKFMFCNIQARGNYFFYYFSYPFLIWRPHSLCSLWNFVLKLTVRKPRVMVGLSSSEDRMIIAGVVLA